MYSLNSPDAVAESAPASSRARRILGVLGWSLFALVCLATFTLLKLPEDRIRNYVHGTISSVLADQGIGFSAGGGRISIGMGISYRMSDVTLTPPPPAEPAKIEAITISPNFLPLLLGRLGGTIRIDQGKGYLKASVSMRKQNTSASLEAKAFDAGKAGLLPLLAEIKGSAIITGKGEIEGDLQVPSTLVGKLAFDLSNIVIDSQPISGFTIPRLAISEGKLETDLDKGKATIRTLRLGKKGNAADDIQGTVSGDVTLGRNWPSSVLNLRTEFGLSQNILRSFALLDALLGMGKRPDGTYAYNITGPISMPTPVPAGQP